MKLFEQHQSLRQYSAKINELMAVDFYLAKQLCSQFDVIPDWFEPLVMALSMSIRQGHSCLALAQLANSHFGQGIDEKTGQIYSGVYFPEYAEMQQFFSQLAISPACNNTLVFEFDCLYLRRYYRFETEFAAQINARINAAKTQQLAPIELIKQQLDRLFEGERQTIDWQKVAVANALNQRFSVIAGGPGTGKTYTVTRLLAAIQGIHLAQHPHSKPLKIAMVAPTGKAAQRLSESINAAKLQLASVCSSELLASMPSTAKTIHRLLGVIPNSNEFKHHSKQLLSLDVLLIDEASMVDIALFYRLFSALPEHCRVILLGDAEQLPSVATGSVLADLAAKPHLGYSDAQNDYLHCVTGHSLEPSTEHSRDYLAYLYQSRRFDGQGGIGLLAKAVIEGDSAACWQYLTEPTPQLSYYTELSDTLLTRLVQQYYLPIFQLAKDEQALSQAFALMAQFRLLTSTKKGHTGVEQLNLKVEQVLRKLGVAIPSVTSLASHYHGQPVMIEQNNYQLGLFNGDIGFIWQTSEGLMAAFLQGEQINWFLPSQLPQHSTVFAMTIHKTQGSEFTHVALCLPQQASKLLTRELLYTGITRAKSALTLTGTQNIWQQGVQQQVSRTSLLAKRILN